MKVSIFILLLICGLNTSFAETAYSNRDWYRSFSSDKTECDKQANQQFPDYNSGSLNPNLSSKAGVVDTGIQAIFGLIGTAIGQAYIQPKQNSAFVSCMSSMGWNPISKEDGDKLVAMRAEITEKINLMQSETNCKNPELTEFFNKSPCLIAELTTKNLGDKTLILPSEVESVKKYKLLYAGQFEKYIELYKQVDTTWSDDLSNAYSLLNIATLENASNLINRKISWGDFNTQRKKNSSLFLNTFNEAQNKLKVAVKGQGN